MVFKPVLLSVSNFSMGNRDIYIELTRPRIRILKKWKLAFFCLLILVSCWLPWHLLEYDTVAMQGSVGEVLLSSGMLPLLLALPIISAKLAITCRKETFASAQEAKAQLCCNSLGMALAYTLYVLMLGLGFYLIEYGESGRRGLVGALAEIFAEVSIINSITTLLQVPAIDDDETEALLTKAEQQQMERTGALNAPYANVVNEATGYEYDEGACFMCVL